MLKTCEQYKRADALTVVEKQQSCVTQVMLLGRNFFQEVQVVLSLPVFVHFHTYCFAFFFLVV